MNPENTASSNSEQPLVPGTEVRNRPRNPIQRVFVGDDGPRALWRLLIFVILFALTSYAAFHVFAAHRPVRAAEVFNAYALLTREFILCICLALSTTIMSVLERRSFRVYGFSGGARSVVRFGEGVFWGFLAVSCSIGMMFAFGDASFVGSEQHGLGAVKFALLWGAVFVMVGFFEEGLFRGYPQFTLSTGIGFWPAACLLSALFWFVHMGNPGETWVGGLAAALVALVFCFALRRTGSLWFPMGIHAGWDWAQTYFYGVADSGLVAPGHLLNTDLHGPSWITGGTVGPEGSVLAIVVVAAMAVGIHLRFPRASYPPTDGSGADRVAPARLS